MPVPGLTMGLTATLQRDLFAELSARFQEVRTTLPHVYERACTYVKSNGGIEIYDFARFMGTETEFLDERIIQKLAVFRYFLENRKWAITVAVKRDEMDDDQLGIIMKAADEKIIVALEGPERRFASFINQHIAGTVTEYLPGFDGQPLFSATHSWPQGYTTAQSNLLSGGNAGKLDLTYGPANLVAADTAMGTTFRWPSGDIIGSTITHIFCSTSVFFNARQLVKSDLVVSGNTGLAGGLPNNNTLKEIGNGNVEIVRQKYLTNGYWWAADLSHAIGPAIFQERDAIELSQQLRDSESGFMRDEYRYGTRSRNNFGPGVWYRAIAGNGT